MSKLRKIAASIGVTFVVFTQTLFASPASAQTLAEAQAALATGKQEVIDATLNKTSADQAVATALANLQAATSEVDAAQSNYDTNLIPDPTWVAPTQQVEHTRQIEQVNTVEHVTQVPHTEVVTNVTQVCHVETVATTTTVPKIVSVPHTELVSTTTHVPTTTIIEHTTTTVVPGGLTATSYNRIGYNNAPPLPTAQEIPVATQNVPNIDFQWGSDQILNSGLYEDVLVVFEGNIMVPTNGWYTFYAPGDDGVKLNIAGMGLIDDWYDKGGGGSVSQEVWLNAGVLYPTTLYFYENGGGANVWLYYATATTGFEIVPPSWFGENTVTETTYEEVTTWDTVVSWQEVTTYEDVTVWEEVTTYSDVEFCEDVVTHEEVITWEDVITYEDVVTTVTETFFTTEPVPDATAPLVHDPALAVVLEDKVVAKNTASTEYSQAVVAQTAAVSRLDAASAALPQLEQAVVDLTPVVPPVVDPPTGPVEKPTPPEDKPVVPPVVVTPPVEPTPEKPVVTPEPPIASVDPATINPQELTATEVAQLTSAAHETLATEPEGSPAYEQALQQLMVAAQADDIVVSEELASVPVIGAVAVGLTNAINAIGNIGADMSPAHRETAKKEVVAAVIVTQVATTAAGIATQAAASAASGAAAGASSRRAGK